MASKAATVTERMKNAPGGWGKALFIGSLVVGFIPLIGVPLSYAVDRMRNNHIEKKKKEVLVDFYRPQIAALVGIDPRRVTINDLNTAAQMDPTIANAIEKVTNEKKSANRAATLSSAGVAAVGFIPGVSGITNGLAKGAVHLGGAFAGSTVSSLLDKDVLFTHDVIEIIDTKRAEGQAITAMDIALLRIAQSPEWQTEFKKKNGKPFHKLSEGEQQAVLASQPDLIMGADRQADALNRGLISPQNLVMAGPESTTNYAASVGPKAAPQSYAAMIEQQRAAAAGAKQLG